jgi:hypothetical protein
MDAFCIGIFDATLPLTPVARRYVKPRPMLSIPRVVIKGLIFNLVITRPLAVPNNNPKMSPHITANRAFWPYTVINLAVSIEVTAIRDPTDRSMPPVIITMVWPIAMIPIVDMPLSMLNRLSCFRKYGLATLIITIMKMSAISTFTSLI